MNIQYNRIQELIKEAENKAINDPNCLYRLGYHLMPPTGWLNDPNGLCQLGDTYHIFFQYSPLHVNGGMKAWGHYTTKNFITYKYCGAPFVPDETFDADGVFSGSAYVDEKGMHIFYTGNVELPGDYDYTTAGRRADTILIESVDGIHFSEKSVVIDTDEYPKEYSCHIRDPKVWEENGMYYMVLGGRTRQDEGRILVYSSTNMKKWTLYKELMTEDKFAYMWECPDLYELDGQYVLSFSPQGLEREEYRYQNIYHAGYFVSKENPIEHNITYDGKCFHEWDMGFDFYAPQSFLDKTGRRILIGWVGVPYAEYTNGEVEEYWQHCLTVPRELFLRVDEVTGKAKVYQYPIEEMQQLRKDIPLSLQDECLETREEYLDVMCSDLPERFSIVIAEGIHFQYEDKVAVLSLRKELGRGRDTRKCKIDRIQTLRILIDSSIIEYYINDGEYVFTTRYYKKEKGTKLKMECGNAKIEIYPMNAIQIQR